MNYSAIFNQYCDSLEPKLTTLRKEVLYVLWCAKRSLKAYEILNELLKVKSNSTPPTVYRVLDFFESQGIVHKIESIQSYTLCGKPEKRQPSEVLMVCNNCLQVIEIYDDLMHSLLARLASNHAFHLKQDVIELKGQCTQCVTAAK
jgi:Fur family zinc uptake transcriptional regulator